MTDLLSRVLFRDHLVIILNKPAGLAVHSGPRGKASLEDDFDQLRFGLPRLPALAHRLDADTSGCLVLGRHPKALRKLGRIFSEGLARKTYLAITTSPPPATKGIIDHPLLKISSKAGGWKMIVSPKGKSAITDYRVLDSWDGHHLLELHPRTGRTHQIRVHLAEIGCPILGEPKYDPALKASAPAHKDRDSAQPSNDQKLYLHARRIELPLYADRPLIDIRAPLPDHFKMLINQYDQSHLSF